MAADVGASAVAHTTSNGTTCTTSGIDTTGVTQLLVAVAWYGSGSAPTISDSKGNTWTGSQQDSTTAFSADSSAKTAAFAINPSSVGSGHTFTATFGAGQDVITLQVVGVTGSPTSSAIDQHTGGVEDTTSAAFDSGNATTGEANELLVAFEFSFTSGGTETTDWSSQSFTELQHQSDGNYFAGACAKRFVASTGTYHSSFTSSGAGASAAITYLFSVKSAGGGAQTITPSGVASAEAFGSDTVSPGAASVAPSGVATLEGFGGSTLSGVGSVAPSGVASAEAFGTAQLDQAIGPTLITYSTTFGTTENPIVEDGGWVLGGTDGTDWTDPSTSGGLVLNGQDNTGDFDDSLAVRPEFAPDVTLTSTVSKGSPSGEHEVEHLFRFDIVDGNARGYEVLWAHGGAYGPEVVRWNGPRGFTFGDGAFDILHDFSLGITLLDGDVIQTSISGNTVTLKRNGSTVGTYDITSGGSPVWNDGGCGVGSYRNGAGAPSDIAWTNLDAVSQTGILSASAFGTASASPSVSPTGIATAEAFGSATLSPGAAPLSPTGIASLEAHGSTVVSPGAATVAPSGAATAEAFGTASLATGPVSVAPSGLATLEAFGAAALILFVVGSAIPSAESFGTDALSMSVVPSGVASTEAFGTDTVTPGAASLAPSGVASLEALGTAAVTTNGDFLQPSGVATLEGFGTAQIDQALTGQGLASLEAFGSALLGLYLTGQGVSTAEAFGSGALALSVLCSGIATGESIDAPIVIESGSLAAQGIASVEAFGSATLQPGGVSVLPSGVVSLEAFGLSTLLEFVVASGIAGAEAFGSASLSSLATLAPQGVAGLEALGTPALGLFVGVSAIDTLEAFGDALVEISALRLTATDIPSAEAFGAAVLVPGGVTIDVSGIASLEGFGSLTIGRRFVPLPADSAGHPRVAVVPLTRTRRIAVVPRRK